MRGNLWRETAFALHLTQSAIMPHLSIEKCIKRWGKIQNMLSEKSTLIKLQMDKLPKLS
jgi:hypothetical protein